MDNQHKYQSLLPQIPATAVDIYRMLPEGSRCEVIFNELIMSPSPSSQHQLLLSDLHVLLYNHLKQHQAGKVIPAPLDVYLNGQVSVVQPDLIVLLNEHLNFIQDDGVYGSPDVAIEILSGNRSYDFTRKRALYEHAGVQEYFLIDPHNKQTTLLALNAENRYEIVYEVNGVLQSAVLKCNISF